MNGWRRMVYSPFMRWIVEEEWYTVPLRWMVEEEWGEVLASRLFDRTIA